MLLWWYRFLPRMAEAFLATVPGLPGCMSDGETEFEAIQNAQDAIQCWLDVAQETNRPIPERRRKAAG